MQEIQYNLQIVKVQNALIVGSLFISQYIYEIENPVDNVI